MADPYTVNREKASQFLYSLAEVVDVAPLWNYFHLFSLFLLDFHVKVNDSLLFLCLLQNAITNIWYLEKYLKQGKVYSSKSISGK